MTQPVVEIIGGIDTHKDTHTAAAIDAVGRQLGAAQFPATATGFSDLLIWLRSWGTLILVGMEGTASYGAGLARHLAAEHVAVVEINRPDRAARRRQGKSDPVDAVMAAQAALSGQRTATPKHNDGKVEALRNLRVPRSGAVAQRTEVMNQIKSLIVTAPETVREQLRDLTPAKLIAACAAVRPDTARLSDPTHAARLALRHLARRYRALTSEIEALDKHIKTLVTQINAKLLDLVGVGPDNAGQLLVTVGDNPERLRSEGAFAMLTGTAPLPASSGRTDRHRLNRGGDRHANAAIHRIVLVRMRYHQPTRDYVERRTTEGLKKRDIMRCLKRLVAREIYYAIRGVDQHKQPTHAAA